MQIGDIVKVRKLRQIHTADGIKNEERVCMGMIICVVDAQELYPGEPKYGPAFHGIREKTRYPKGTRIFQIKLDDDVCARNFEESAIVQ